MDSEWKYCERSAGPHRQKWLENGLLIQENFSKNNNETFFSEIELFPIVRWPKRYAHFWAFFRKIFWKKRVPERLFLVVQIGRSRAVFFIQKLLDLYLKSTIQNQRQTRKTRCSKRTATCGPRRRRVPPRASALKKKRRRTTRCTQALHCALLLNCKATSLAVASKFFRS